MRPQTGPGGVGALRLLRLFVFIGAALTATSSVATAQSDGRTPVASPDGAWRTVEADSLAPGSLTAASITQSGALARLDVSAMSRTLAVAPLEFATRIEDSRAVVYLPLPTGGFARFRIVESNILDPALAARFPEIKSYSGQGIDDPAATVRFGWSPQGISGLILGDAYSVHLSPRGGLDSTVHRSAFGEGTSDFNCGVRGDVAAPLQADAPEIPEKIVVGSQLRVYRAAIATSLAYLNDAQLGNGTVGGAVASINGWLNGVNAFYEREVAVRLTLVDNTAIIGLPANQIDNASESNALGQIPAILGTMVGTANYDIGHILITQGGGGVAGLGVVCNSANPAAPSKGGGSTSLVGPAGAGGSLDVLIHELGHQFGAAHTFNGTQGGCAGNRDANSGVEPGSGITIMSYGGGCAADNVGHYDKSRFHNWSLRAIDSYLAGTTCGSLTATGNGAPTASAGPDRTIPKGTPFALTATASDPDAADLAQLTFNWEQVDPGGAFPQNGTAASFTDATDPSNTTRPIFRAFASSSSPTRIFPSLTYILNNANVPPVMTGTDFTAEILPAISRSLNFRVTVRDNRASGGGVADDQVTLTVDGASGPFVVTAPNTAGVVWTTGGTETVTWNVANTNAAPVSANNVRIRLSVDGGQTFPYLLAGPTPNDGSQSVTVPAGLNTAAARVKVEADGNIFFDISDASFTINAGTGCPAVASIVSSAGSVGSSITLTGSGFTGITSVSFSGSAAATFSVVSDTSLTATVPAGAMSGPLTLAKNSCSATPTPAFTVCATAQTGQVDDGALESASSGPTHWVNRITPTSYPATLTAVSIFFHAGGSPALGAPFTVLSASNPTGGSSINGLSFQSTAVTAQASGAFRTYAIPPITINSGDFVVGFVVTTGGSVSVPVDTSSVQNRSYFSSSTAAFSPETGGNFMIRAAYSTSCTAPSCVTVSGVSPNNGAPGTSVAITGTGFAGVTSVRFGGGTPALFQVLSDTQISAVVPPGASSGAITLGRPGCADASTATFTVATLTCPVITALSPSSAAPGSTITMTGSGFSGLDVARFSVDTSAVFAVSSDTQVQLTVPVGVSPGPITLSKSGCATVQSGTFLPCDTVLQAAVDDGSLESASGGPTHWVNRVTPATYPATLTGVSIYFGSGAAPALNAPFTVLAASNPTGASNIDGLVFQSTAVTAQANGAFRTYAITPITINSGDFVVGFVIDTSGSVSVPVDTSSVQNRSYYSSSTAAFNAETGGNFMIRGAYSLVCPPTTPSLSINDVSVTEGNTGSVNATFTVSLSATSASTVTVSAATAAGTATSGTDFTATGPTTLTFAAGETSKTFSVPVIGDTNVEAHETFVVNLSSPTNATIADNQGTGTISNDDTALSINDVSVTEGNTGSVNATFTVSLSAASALTVTVSAATAPGTATSGTDFTATGPTTLTFAAGETSKTFSVPVIGDTDVEANETFVVNLSTATNATIADNQGTATITNDDAASVNASIDDVAVAEGNAGSTNANFTVSLSAASASTLTLNYATANGTAVGAATSTQSNTATITIPMDSTNATPYPSNIVVAGALGTITKATVTLNAYSHTYSSDTDILLVGPGGQKIVLMSDAGGPGAANNVNITLDATAASSLPTSTLSSGTFRPTNLADGEGEDTWGTPAPAAPYTGTLTDLIGTTPNGTWSLYVTDDVTADGGSLAGGWTLTLETTGGDYTPTTGTLTFAPGDTSKTITVVVNGDTTVEANETFTVNLSNASPGLVITDATGAGTINDDDGVVLPNLSINDVSLTEGDAATSNMTFTVTLSTASASTVTVSAVTSAGTAAATTDYTTTGPSTITFNPGDTTKTFVVPIVGDTLDEVNETFTVTLSSATNANISDNQGTGTITDDDAAPTVSIGNATLTEGDASTSNMSFTVSLSAASGRTVTVSAVTAAGTATATTDYTTTGPSTLTFTAGTTTQNFVVPIVGDTLDEANETFTVTLSSPSNASLGTATGTGTITDNDAAPSLSINDVAVTEGNSGSLNATFTVTLSPASGQTVTVSAATAAGTATSGADFTATGSTLTFTAGVTTQNFSVPVIGDTADEANETFVVNLSSANNANIADNQGTGTILNDDGTSSLTINDVSLTEGNSGSANMTFTVSLLPAAAGTVTVAAQTANGTATAGTDYTATGPTTLTFAAGETSKTFSVPVLGDTTSEANETVLVNLTGATGPAAIGDNQGTGTITNDDASPTISINDVSLAEGTAGSSNLTFAVTLSAASGQTITVSAVTAAGTATAGTDYTATGPSTLTFTAGVTTQNFSVPVIGDTDDEPNETFTVNLSSPTNATIADGVGVGTIGNDDSVWGQNTTAAKARSIVTNAIAPDALSASRTEVWHKTQLFANRSYQISAWTVGEDGAPGVTPLTLEIFSDAAGTVAATPTPTAVSGPLEGSPNESAMFSQSSLYQPATSGVYRIRLAGAPGAADTSVNLVVRETTLFSPWFFVSGASGYDAYHEIHNNTSGPLQVTLRAYGPTGAQLGVTHTFTLPANATVAKSSKTDLSVGDGVFGGTVLTHDGAFGAVSANTTTLSGVTGLSFDSPFTTRSPATVGKPIR